MPLLKTKKMKRNKLFLIGAVVAALTTIFSTGCTPEETTYDETGYPGTYVGYHRLVDSASLSALLGDIDYSFYDTLVVTNGTSTTDGKIYAKSSYLGGNTIEIDVSTSPAAITPKVIGTIQVDATTLTDTKIGSGSTATWDASKNNVAVKITAGATYGVIVLPPSIKLWGDFVKQ